MQAMGTGFDAEYFPDRSRSAIYNHRYAEYKKLGAAIENLTNPST